MKKVIGYRSAAAIAALFIICIPGMAKSEDLIVKTCPELLRMAETAHEDMRTVDTMLGSAIEAGNMDKIKNYKLKKAAVRKQLESVLNAIDLRGCVKK